MLNHIHGFGDDIFPGRPGWDKLIESMIYQESGGNPNAVSNAGAAGLMQIMPDTARQPGFGVRPLDWSMRFDPAENRRFGTEYMASMAKRYDGDVVRALVAYNWGVGNADAWSGDMGALPKETQQYVQRVMAGAMAGQGGGAGSGAGTGGSGGAGARDTSAWLRYANQSATRSQKLDPRLTDALSFLGDMGVTMEVFSGGQPGKGEGGARVGSTRHDHGMAADAVFFKDGRQLDWANPQDRPVFEEIVRRGKAAGLTGFGAGNGYMRPGSMHLGFGAPSVWGAGGSGANAPNWLREAYASAPAGPTPPSPTAQASYSSAMNTANMGSQTGAPAAWSNSIEAMAAQAAKAAQANRWAKLDQRKAQTGQGYFGVGQPIPMAALAGPQAAAGAPSKAAQIRIIQQSEAAAAPLVTVPST